MRSFEASPKERQAFPITQPDTRSARENRSVSRPRAIGERVYWAMGVSAAYRSQRVFNPALARYAYTPHESNRPAKSLKSKRLVFSAGRRDHRRAVCRDQDTTMRMADIPT